MKYFLVETQAHTVWKLRFTLIHFWQKFRESNGFTTILKRILKS